MTDIKIQCSPYGERLYTRSHILLNEGLTVIIGGNGAGKTTLLRMIADRLRKDRPDSTVIRIDANVETGNLLGGGLNRREFTRSLGALFESEGMRRWHAVADRFAQIGQAVRDPDLSDLWILFDGIDSGVDVEGLTAFFDTFDKTIASTIRERDVPLHVVMSATTYEPVRHAQNHGGTILTLPRLKPIRFRGYEDWRDWMLHSAKQIAQRREAYARKEKTGISCRRKKRPMRVGDDINLPDDPDFDDPSDIETADGFTVPTQPLDPPDVGWPTDTDTGTKGWIR